MLLLERAHRVLLQLSQLILQPTHNMCQLLELRFELGHPMFKSTRELLKLILQLLLCHLVLEQLLLQNNKLLWVRWRLHL